MHVWGIPPACMLQLYKKILVLELINMQRGEKRTAYFFILPAVTLLIIFRLVPALAGLLESLSYNPLNIVGKPPEYGMKNFLRLLKDPSFWNSVKVTFIFNLIVNPIQIIFALGLSLLCNKALWGIKIFRSVYLIPVAVSFAVTAIIWGIMLDYNSGLINGLLVLLGGERQPFLVSSSHALLSISAVVTWKAVPFWMIFLLAGLQGIPSNLYDAGAIDGTTRWQFLTRITIPLLKPVILFVLVADTVGNFILFEPVYLLTRGGPQQSTNLLMYDAYKRGFVYGDMSLSAAMIIIQLIILSIILLLEFTLLRKEK